ncbi:SUKH-4 family immunity protein [Streptomyces niveus]|uniref:SUKH-4 family immunity protein n=1 Tax=Streptomyces niveus TaxID=193462 RepID=UPI0036B6B275
MAEPTESLRMSWSSAGSQRQNHTTDADKGLRLMRPVVEELEAAFSHWGVEITRATTAEVSANVCDENAQFALTDLGLPERLGDGIFFHDLSSGCLTVGELLRQPGENGTSEAAGLIYLASAPHDDTVVLSGVTGEVFSWRNGELRRVSSSLEHLVGFLYTIQVQRNEIERLRIDSDEEFAGIAERLLSALKDTDPVAMDNAEAYWAEVLTYTL